MALVSYFPLFFARQSVKRVLWLLATLPISLALWRVRDQSSLNSYYSPPQFQYIPSKRTRERVTHSFLTALAAELGRAT